MWEESKQLHCVHSRVRGSGRDNGFPEFPGVQLEPSCRAPTDGTTGVYAVPAEPKDFCLQIFWVNIIDGFVNTVLKSVYRAFWKILPGYVNNHLNREILGSHFHSPKRWSYCRMELHLYNQELPLHLGKTRELRETSYSKTSILFWGVDHFRNAMSLRLHCMKCTIPSIWGKITSTEEEAFSLPRSIHWLVSLKDKGHISIKSGKDYLLLYPQYLARWWYIVGTRKKVNEWMNG